MRLFKKSTLTMPSLYVDSMVIIFPKHICQNLREQYGYVRLWVVLNALNFIICL
jgi:hypothetical protein